MPDHPDTSPPSFSFQLPVPGLTDGTQVGLWDGVPSPAFDAQRASIIEGYSDPERMLLAMSDTRLSPTARLVNAVLARTGWAGKISRGVIASLLTIPKQNVSRYLREIEKITGMVRPGKRSRRRNQEAEFQYAFSGMDLLEVVDRRAAFSRDQSDSTKPFPRNQSDSTKPFPRNQSDSTKPIFGESSKSSGPNPQTFFDFEVNSGENSNRRPQKIRGKASE